MNWDELFEDRLADAGHRVGAIDEAGDHVTLVEATVGEVVRVVREALLSDEAIERAARVVTPRLYWDYADWGEASECGREEARIIARKVLTAAIGDET